MTALLRQMLLDAPAGLWPLNEAAGTTGKDVVAGRDLTHQGGVVGGGGSFLGQKATVYDGVDDVSKTALASALLWNATAASLVVWWYASSTAFSTFIALRDTASGLATGEGPSFSINFPNPGDVRVRWVDTVPNAYTIVYSGAVNDGRWHQAVFVHDATNRELFVDGVSRGTSTGTMGVTPTQMALVTGANWNVTVGSQFTPCGLAMAGLYSSRLSAARVMAQYQAGIRQGVTY